MADLIKMAEIELSDAEINAAVEVLRSGAIRQGSVCEMFEQAFAEKVGAKYALTCSSGRERTGLEILARSKAITAAPRFLAPTHESMAGGPQDGVRLEGKLGRSRKRVRPDSGECGESQEGDLLPWDHV